MNTESHDRRKIQERLESGQTKVVCNIATLTKGIDWKIGCIIIARPTRSKMLHVQIAGRVIRANSRSEEHTSELQSLMRISYAVFCLKKKKTTTKTTHQ